MEQVRIFLDDKLFVLENEKRQKAKVRYAAYESQICAHDPRAGKDSCNCNGCRKELKILKDVIERASAQGQYEGVPLHSRSKKAPLKAALSEHTQLLEAIVKDVHTLSLSIKNLPSEADKLPKRVTFRELPKHLTFMALPVPSEWPRHIKKAVSDYEYVLFQIDTERDTLINQRGEVRRLLLIGMGDVNSIWHERDELITDCPEVQRYEYTRNSVLTMFVVGGNLETTIHRYVRKEGVKLSGALSEALGLQRPCIPKWRKASWEETFAAMKQEANSIDDMLRQCEKARQNLPSEEAEEATAKYGDWWKVLVDKGTSKKLRAPTANMIA